MIDLKNTGFPLSLSSEKALAEKAGIKPAGFPMREKTLLAMASKLNELESKVAELEARPF